MEGSSKSRRDAGDGDSNGGGDDECYEVCLHEDVLIVMDVKVAHKVQGRGVEKGRVQGATAPLTG